MLSPMCSLSCRELCALAVGLITRRDIAGMVSSIVVSRPNQRENIVVWVTFPNPVSDFQGFILVCFLMVFRQSHCALLVLSQYIAFFPSDIFRAGLILAQSPLMLIASDTIGNHSLVG